MDQPLPHTYEDSLRELQSLVQSLEQGDVRIDKLPERLDRAQQLLAHCREKLKNIGETLPGGDQ